DQRKTVIGPSGLRVTAAVVSEAAMVGRELRELVLPIFEPVDFTVNENHVAALACHLVMEVAAIRLDQRHALLTCRRGWRRLHGCMRFLGWHCRTLERLPWRRGRSER